MDKKSVLVYVMAAGGFLFFWFLLIGSSGFILAMEPKYLSFFACCLMIAAIMPSFAEVYLNIEDEEMEVELSTIEEIRAQLDGLDDLYDKDEEGDDEEYA